MSSSENDGKMKITVSINFGAGVTLRKVAYTDADGPGELSIPLNEFELVDEDAEEQEEEA